MKIPTYSLRERDRRWALARDLMREEGLDALLVYGEHELVPIGPYHFDSYFSNDRPGTIVMFIGQEDPYQLTWSSMHIGDHIEAGRRGDELWIDPSHIRVGKDAAHVAALLTEHGLDSGVIGVTGLEPYPPWHILPILPYALYQPLLEGFPKAEFKPVWVPLLKRMMPNSEEELAVIRHGAAVADEICEVMLAATKPGVTDAEVMAAGMEVAYRRAAQPHILMGSGPGPVSWGDAPWAYRPQPPRVLADGDVIMAEVLNAFGRKETQSQLAIAIGEVHPDIERAAVVARACYDAGLALYRPGNTFGEVAEAMVATVKEADGWNIHPMVHAINPYGPVCGFGWGLKSYPAAQAYGEIGEVPTIGGELTLEPGMTFIFEPSCVYEGGMVNLGGTVVVGEDGPIELNPLTAQLLRAAA